MALFWVYFKRNRIIEKQLNKLRDIQVDYFRYLNDLLHGFKEVKMNTRRNNLLYNNYILANRVQGLDLGIKTKIRDVNNERTGNFSWYIVVGLIMYILPNILSLNKENTTTLIVAILYMMGPVASIIGFVLEYTMIKIAAERITSLQKELSVLPMQATDDDEKNELDADGPFRNLRLHGITYQYQADEDTDGTPFHFGPVDLEIRQGETLFITGGNGSGKSTLINLMTGLYKPEAGSILYNDIAITDENRVAFSNKISAIFSDMHMFRENYDGFDLGNDNEVFRKYVDLMQMKDMVDRNRENNSIKPNFSKGQRKRMGMIYCLLESREIFVLDEWAAEQDPEFRKYFYTDLLPILKANGKTIIAVTHDDHYFSCADRIVKLEYGKVAYDRERIKHSIYAHA
ncbi:MAG TPA: ATP-binding cassette domain-containing protein, partial [Chitinophagaceae bacterium]|nr:ATP-binding cassette domain-containing protein [Chitinophagaceae bacterium]